MEIIRKESSIFKKLERYLSNKSRRPNSTTTKLLTKSKSWHSSTKEKHKVAPSGCFSVYVGEEKQRFVIKIEFASHPLFKMLLEDAEMEYGFHSEGPLMLPCEVDLFCKVLGEMDSGKECDDPYPRGSGFGSCSPFIRLGKSSDMAKDHSSYGLLTPSRSLMINHF